LSKEHEKNYEESTSPDGLRTAGLSSALRPTRNVVQSARLQYACAITPRDPDQDFFYYVNKEDENEAFESLGYNPRCMNSTQEDDFRVNKFWR